MARIAGIDLPKEKRVEIGLTYIYGIGRPMADKILAATEVNPDTRVKDLTEDEVQRLREYIDKNVVTEGDLHRDVSLSVKRLMEIGCYRGIRHRKGLPFADRAPSRTRAPARDPSARSAERRSLDRERNRQWQLKKRQVKRR